MRAREPDAAGIVERGGARIAWESFGNAEHTVFFLPAWSIVHSRLWKAQVPYFARHFRVVTFDAIGNGGSDRPLDPARYAEEEQAADALAVLDATGTARAALVSLSRGALRGLILAATHPDRVTGAAFVAPSVPVSATHPDRAGLSFEDVLPSDKGWAKFNRHYWQRDYRGFLEFFFSRMFTEPHSTKQIEDGVGWGLETTAEALIASQRAPHPDADRVRAWCGQVRCPVLVLHGDEDAIIPHERGAALAEATGGTLVTLAGSGHGPHARDPVTVNLLLRQFLDPRPDPPARSTRAARRRRRALYVSSPIGLGHAQRDVAVARELRRLVPDLEIDWLAQHPVTAVLEAEGERIHPASASLVNESRHIESESAEHDLHCFQAWRRMDEILVANFMAFLDLVREESYDLWIGDEAWELDYFLHENPDQKRTPYAWLTDFVGWLPMPDGGAPEAALTADYNAEMIQHIARYPRLRDRALFVGHPEDIVAERFGPGLPDIRSWTEAHFAFPGYITGFDPAELGTRERLREELGYRPGERVCLVTVGGSAVGEHLLRRIAAAHAEARRRVDGLRMILVTGPRIDPHSVPAADGLEVRPYVHHLYRHLAACDLAIVQGGLTTAMELTANRRPFLYFPLRHHFEQNYHVRHRLERYGAGVCMDYATACPEVIADAIANELGRVVTYRPVENDGARRAATLLAELF